MTSESTHLCHLLLRVHKACQPEVGHLELLFALISLVTVSGVMVVVVVVNLWVIVKRAIVKVMVSLMRYVML
jgi:hypothetical protein